MPPLPVALTIAGSDSGGGAGIQADLLTFAACGVYATSAITCLTAQNPDGVSGIHAVPGDFVREQAERVTAYFKVGAVKTGMLLNADIIGARGSFLSWHPANPLRARPGDGRHEQRQAARGGRARRAAHPARPARRALVTPGTPTRQQIFLGRSPAGSPPTQVDDALALAKILGVPMLLKGGHAGTGTLTDIFATPDGETGFFTAHRHETVDTHGSGCTLAAAVTARLAKGDPLPVAVAAAHAYLQRAIHAPLRVAGRDFIAHLR